MTATRRIDLLIFLSLVFSVAMAGRSILEQLVGGCPAGGVPGQWFSQAAVQGAGTSIIGSQPLVAQV